MYALRINICRVAGRESIFALRLFMFALVGNLLVQVIIF